MVLPNNYKQKKIQVYSIWTHNKLNNTYSGFLSANNCDFSFDPIELPKKYPTTRAKEDNSPPTVIFNKLEFSAGAGLKTNIANKAKKPVTINAPKTYRATVFVFVFICYFFSKEIYTPFYTILPEL